MSIIEQLKAAIDERERRASLALRFRQAYLEHGKLETWVAVRHVNNHTPPYYDYWAVEAHLGGLIPKTVMRFDSLAGQLDAEFFAANGAPIALAMVAAHRKILAECEYEIADSEMRDTGDGLGLAQTMIGLLAKGYGIEANQ